MASIPSQIACRHMDTGMRPQTCFYCVLGGESHSQRHSAMNAVGTVVRLPCTQTLASTAFFSAPTLAIGPAVGTERQERIVVNRGFGSTSGSNVVVRSIAPGSPTFSGLSLELREMIWKMAAAAATPRTIKITKGCHLTGGRSGPMSTAERRIAFFAPHASYRAPSIVLQINNESRRYGMSTHVLAFEKQLGRSIHINFAVDTLHFANYASVDAFHNFQSNSSRYGPYGLGAAGVDLIITEDPVYSTIQRIAINPSCFHSNQGPSLMARYTGLRHLFLLLDNGLTRKQASDFMSLFSLKEAGDVDSDSPTIILERMSARNFEMNMDEVDVMTSFPGRIAPTAS